MTSKDLSFAFYPGWVTDRNQSPGNPERFKHGQVSGLCKLKNLSTTSIDKYLLPDGLEVLRRELSLADVMGLIERTARWVDPKAFDYLPVWYPEHARRGLFYKANWSEPQMNTNRQTRLSVHKSEGNIHANKALTLAAPDPLALEQVEKALDDCVEAPMFVKLLISRTDPGFPSRSDSGDRSNRTAATIARRCIEVD